MNSLMDIEGGRSARIEDGKLILESKAGVGPAASSKDFKVFYETNQDHLVYWLKREVPADFPLEVLLRPQNKQMGLNIIFFSTRGLKGESALDSTLAPRDGTFRQYHTGDLNGYHVSYWAAPRGTTHIRKNRGFHLVAVSDLDPIAGAPAETFETLRIYKRREKIRVTVNDRVIVAWDDDGKTFGPAILHSGWIGLRQMGYTLRTDYDRMAIYPLKASQKGGARAGNRRGPKRSGGRDTRVAVPANHTVVIFCSLFPVTPSRTPPATERQWLPVGHNSPPPPHAARWVSSPGTRGHNSAAS